MVYAGSTDEPITQTDPIDISQPEEPDDQELNDNTYVLSRAQSVGPNSFVDYRQPYKKKAPPPKYFTEDVLLE